MATRDTRQDLTGRFEAIIVARRPTQDLEPSPATHWSVGLEVERLAQAVDRSDHGLLIRECGFC